jgi:hypothetical protein
MVLVERIEMIIKYSDGRKSEGLILAPGDSGMRVAMKGGKDAVDFVFMAGGWVSEDGEPVGVEYAWEQHTLKQSVLEVDCVCSKELAVRLIHLLHSREEYDRTTDMPFNLAQDSLPLHVN